MGKGREHPPVKIIVAFTRRSGTSTEEIYHILEEKFSVIERISACFDFGCFTDYYSSEMGPQLEKDFIVFTALEIPEALPEFKLWTNELEDRYSRAGQRTINLDPGYVCEAKVVLATTKNYTHRLYLGKGIFGDVHLVYRNHTFNAQPWTYPDYKQPEIINFFNLVRENYMQQLGEFYRRRGNN